MSPEILFRTHFVLGYVAWLLGFGVYICPRLKAMDHTCRTPGAYAAWLEALLDNQRQSAAASALPATRDLDTGELLATERRVASAVTEQRDSPRDMGHAGARRRAIVIRRNGVSMPWSRPEQDLSTLGTIR